MISPAVVQPTITAFGSIMVSRQISSGSPSSQPENTETNTVRFSHGRVSKNCFAQASKPERFFR